MVIRKRGDMKAAFLTLGCKLNYAETSTYERALLGAGFEAVPWKEKADVYLVNTCSVTGMSDSKSRNLVRKVHRVNPEARIYVTGCSAQLRREDLAALEGVAGIFGCNEKSSVVPAILRDCGIAEATDEPCHGNIFPAYSSGERTRSFLKVQDGCNNFCAYCTVPYARGESRNVPIADIVAQAREIAAKGVREIVLTGVNTGDFGRTTLESFLDLLKALNEVEGIERYRISSIEPNLITEEIIDWTASGTKFQPHFHIPLQSGSDEILKAMGRRYDTALFESRINHIRKAFEGPGKPEVFFGIDLIAGLPGETDALFAQTTEFLRRIRPAFIHVFPYSRRPGTPAAAMGGQVADRVKSERVAQIEHLCSQLHGEFILRNRGIAEKVLFESTPRKGMMEGYTGNYIRIERPYDPSMVGKLVDIVI